MALLITGDSEENKEILMANTDKTVDARGLACPMPIVKLAQMMKNMEIGHIIEVIASDHSFTPDVEAWCKKTGHMLINIEEDHEEIRAYVMKTK